MEDVAGVKVAEGAEELVDDVLLVDVLEDAALLDDVVQVGVHVLEDEVDVPVIVRFQDVEKLHDVGVPPELLQEHDLPRTKTFSSPVDGGSASGVGPEGPLGVRLVAEGVEDLLEGDDFIGAAVEGLPHDPVRPLPQPLSDLHGPVLC